MNNFQRVFKNTTFLFISEVFIKIFGLFYFIFLARSLSIDVFGRYNLVTSVVTIFSFLPDLGIGLVIVREIAKKTYNVPLLLGNALIVMTAMSVVTIIILLTFGKLLGFSSDVMFLLFISSLTLLVSQVRSIPLFYFDGIEHMGYSAVLKALNSLLFMGFGTAGFVLGFGLTGIIIGFLLGGIVSLLASWAVFLSKGIRISLKFEKKVTKHMVYNGLPLGLAAFSALIYSNIDGIMLERMLSERALGVYSSATKFGPTLIQLLNVPFVVAVYPALSRLSVEHVGRFQRAILKSGLAVLAWSVPSSVAVALFAGVIPFIFGERYVQGVPILRVLIFFVPFASLSALLYKVLIVINKQNWYLGVSIIGVIINVVLNLVLIPKISIVGAAVSSVITQAILFIIYLSLVKKFVYKV